MKIEKGPVFQWIEQKIPRPINQALYRRGSTCFKSIGSACYEPYTLNANMAAQQFLA